MTERTIVITGASGGIGSALVRRFLADGEAVVALDLTDEGLARLRNDLGSPAALDTYACDITDEKAVFAFAEHLRGRGTGVDDAGLARKIAAVEAAVALHRVHLADPLEVMRRVGGREIAAIGGAIMAARLQRVPVLLDGYVATAAAAILHAMDPLSIDHVIAGHVSAEGAHADVLARLGKKPLLDLGMRLGEGSGAALAIGLVKAALACHRDMATFAQAGVPEKE